MGARSAWRRWRSLRAARRHAARLADPSGPFALAPRPPTLARLRALADALGIAGWAEGTARWHGLAQSPAATGRGALPHATAEELNRALRTCYADAEPALSASAGVPRALAAEWARGMVAAWLDRCQREADLAAAFAGDHAYRATAAPGGSGLDLDRALARFPAADHLALLRAPLSDALGFLYASGIEAGAEAAKTKKP